MREIVLDTETTGLDPFTGDRIVEIGCVEILNQITTGEVFHIYLNPQRDMPEEAFRVHGLSAEFLADKPLFAQKVDEFLAFIGEDRLVIHNAEFDMKFINHELQMVGRPKVPMSRVVDTLALARRKHPGASNTLDALCSRYGIDNSRRTKHGALLDSEILAEVYAELQGGRQSALSLASETATRRERVTITVRPRPEPLAPLISAQEEAEHRAFLAKLGDKAIWNDYLPAQAERA